MSETPLDAAHRAMEADEAQGLAFWRALAEAELYLLLAREPSGRDLDPETFETGEGTFVLAFDREERLAAFAEGVRPYAALPGRALAAMLAGQGVGLGFNLGVAPSSMLVEPASIDWLHDLLKDAPDEMEARIEEVMPPGALPEALLRALDAKLARAEGLARMAYLARGRYDSGALGDLLVVIGALPGAEGAIARAVREALVFSGLEAGALDVSFLPASHPMAARLARVGLRFDLPQPALPAEPRGPGTDPDRPPKLR